MDSIKESLKKLTGEGVPLVIEEATVLGVTGRTCTVELTRTGLKLEGVKIQVGGTDEGIFIKPKKESKVLIAFAGKFPFVVLFTEIDELVWDGGKLGGLVKIQELTDKLNELVDWCKNHTHTNSTFSGTISGNPASGTLTVPAPLQAPENFKKSDYENEKIKQ